MFGDEALEWIGSGCLYVYAFVSIHPDHLAFVRAAVNAAKRAIRPNVEPDTWPWHTWEIRDSRWRIRHKVALNIREIDSQLRSLAAAIANERDGRFISVTVFPPYDLGHLKRSSAERTVRDRTLIGSIVGITEFLTRRGFTPQFTIEAQSLDHQHNQIDNFVERVGRGLRHDLGYHYICRGKMVGLPTTAPKGSTTEMEIADFVAYSVRRFFHLGKTDLACEVPPSLFGEVFWGAFTPQRFGTHMATGFPDDYFFPTGGWGTNA